ncbi:MAG: hypothetical protein ABIQ88_09180 [Chitinophagaceae bacterium]
MKKNYAPLPAMLVFLLGLHFAQAQSQVYFLNGGADIDLSGCSAGISQGSLAASFTVLRVPSLASGNARVSINGLPAGVKAKIVPEVLDFAGGVYGQPISIVFQSAPGVFTGDNVVTLTVADNANSTSFLVFVHGMCPRNNKDFTVQGSFFSSYNGLPFPIEGALVAIYQDKSWAVDPRVGDYVHTDANGHFSADIHTSETGTYYAKCIMNDGQGVYMRDWYTSGIKDYNSANRASNQSAIVDLGGTLFIRDGGSTISKSTIWQGARTAFQDFIATTGTAPPTGDYEIVIQNTVTDFVWTARSTTNWEDKHSPYKYNIPTPKLPTHVAIEDYINQFDNYSTNFHEFGHALRHTVDGDQRHFLDDAERWTYARKHNWCGSSPWIDVEAYAFNEGWAEYWSRDPSGVIRFNCPGISVTDITIEGGVAMDLNSIESQLATCLKQTAPFAVPQIREQRKGMFNVLNRGQNIIHSDGEFRDNFRQQFPTCGLLPPGVGVSILPVARTPMNRRITRVESISALQAIIRNQQVISSKLQEELVTATKKQATVRCKICDTLVSAIINPEIIKGKIAYSNLIGQAYQQRLQMFANPANDSLVYRSAFSDRSAKELELFTLTYKKILRDCLEHSVALLSKRTFSITKGRETAQTFLQRKINMLDKQTPVNNELYAMLSLPVNAFDDQVVMMKKKDKGK